MNTESDSPASGTLDSAEIERRRATRFVWATWALMTLVTGAMVYWLGIRIPFWDEWDATVPFVTGEWPVTWSALWGSHNEHRIVLPRLILAGLDQLTDHNFRAGMFLTVALLSATSAALLMFVRRLRGYWVWTDAFFPCLLLNWGHAENLVWSFQLQFSLVCSFGCLATALMADRERPNAVKIACLGALLLLWPLCSAAGIICGLIIGLFFAGCWYWRREPEMVLSKPTLALAAAMMVLIPIESVLTFVPRSSIHKPATDHLALIRDILLEFGMVFGQGIVRRVGIPVSLVCLGLSALTLYWLWRGSECMATSRLARWGLALAIVAHLALACALAWARSGLGQAHAARYTTLLAPLLVAIYLAAVRCAPVRVRPVVTGTLCVLQFVLAIAYAVSGRAVWEERKIQADAFEQDIENGVPLAELIERYSGRFHPKDEVLTREIRRLHAAQIGIFAKIPMESPMADAEPTPPPAQ
ncbi:MAG: hypothetical protein JSS02_16790 [Planctomycetes bacterium]|nr:hypothetical protein [Planctomycetota bacterium]